MPAKTVFDEAEFRDAVRRGLSESQVAVVFRMSLPTVKRWKRILGEPSRWSHPASRVTDAEIEASHRSGMTRQEIADKHGVSLGFVKSCVKRLALARNPMRSGDRSRSWKGGRVRKSGYILVSNRVHPRSSQHGYVREHILIAESKIGRFLRSDEVVHHLNGIKSDNRPENLEVMSKRQHCAIHLLERKARLTPEQRSASAHKAWVTRRSKSMA